MEEVIKFRLNVNQLNTQEFNELFHKIGNKSIASIMLKGFLYMHEHSKNEYDESTDNTKNINDIISNIITSRKTNESTQTKNTNKSHNQLKINKLPNAMIQKCASYLDASDYFDFSQCDGLIYVACNTPVSLEELDMTEDGYPNNLIRFRLLKKLCITPRTFIRKYDENICQLPNIKSLTLDLQHSRISTRITTTNCINLANIEELKCVSFGEENYLYDFKTFYKLLRQFPNVSHLEIKDVYLTEIDNHVNEIQSLLPKLTAFTCDCNDINAKLFRNKMINTHSKQIVHLNYDEDDIDLNIDSIDLFQLKELVVGSPNVDSLAKFIEDNSKLQRIRISSVRNMDADNNEKFKRIIILLYNKYAELRQISLNLNPDQFEKIVEWTEIGLCDLQYSNLTRMNNYLKIIYEVDYDDENVSIYQIGLYLNRIINALNMSPIEHFEIDFTLYGNINVESKLELISKLKQKYLAFSEFGVDEDDDEFHKIIICNKECTINGFEESWMF